MIRREATHPAAERKALTPKFLIATPRLEFPLTPTKQSPLTFSNRDYMRILHPPWRIAVFQFFVSRCRPENRSRTLRRVKPGLPVRPTGVPPALLTCGRASRTAGIPAGAFDFSCFIPRHSSLIAAFLIY